MREEWRGFEVNHWQDDVNVRDFIQKNYTCYDGTYKSYQQGHRLTSFPLPDWLIATKQE